NFPPLSPDELESYLERIGLVVEPNAIPSLELLNSVLFRHASTIPFENGLLRFLDVKPSLKPADLHASLVANRRGGYCFQVNTLLLSALRSLGFLATPGVARSSLWDIGLQERVLGGTTHMVVFIELDGKLFMADMGYSQIGLTCAIEMKHGVEVDCAAGERHRVVESDLTSDGGFLLLHRRAEGAPFADGVDPESGGFGEQFYFTRERYRPQDYEVFNYYVSHCPDHVMMKSFIVSIVTETAGRAVIVDKKFKRREDNEFKHLERVVEMSSVEELADIMKTEFGIVMSEVEKGGARALLFCNEQ
ncbi:hypothetical protein HDU98_008827, partial [Podochytrium sp. JEL0797]